MPISLKMSSRSSMFSGSSVQKLKETEEITQQDSLVLVKNLFRIAIYHICYIRELFPENYFSDVLDPVLQMKIKKLKPTDVKSQSLINWVEKGVYDMLQNKYLEKLLFQINDPTNTLTMEEYEFSFSYSSSDNNGVSMNINHKGNKKQGTSFKSNATTDIIPNQMRSSACKLIRTLVQLMQTLDPMPEKHTIWMRATYHKDTPKEYSAPFFMRTQEGPKPWMKNPLEMEVGYVNCKHIQLALKVKSVLDPCQDDNNDSKDDKAVILVHEK